MLLVAGVPTPVRDDWAGVLAAAACDIATLQERLAREPDLKGLVFYQSPWEAFLAACDLEPAVDMGEAGRNGLRSWLAEADAMLAAASRWPGRLRLVNAGRLATREQALADALAADGWCMPVAAPLAGDEPPVSTTLLARLFEEHAPEGWDAYESLESMATLLGREAEFRGAGADTDDLLAEAMRIWGGAVAARLDAGRAHEQVRRSESGRAESEVHRGRAERSRQSLQEELADRDALAAQLSSENDLLLEHVAQLRQELAEQARSAAEMRDTVVRLTRAADQARRMISG